MRGRIGVLLLGTLGLIGCDGTDPTGSPAVEVATVVIDPDEATLGVGDTLRLTAHALDADGEPLDVAVAWSVDSPARLALVGHGAIGRTTALAVGAVTVTATADGHSATAELSIVNPLPQATHISPASVPAGSGEFTLTVTGANFTAASTVQLNGSNRPTTFVGSGELRALIAATDVAAEGQALVRVSTPAPGGGTSGALVLLVDTSSPPPPPPPPPPAVDRIELDVDTTALIEGETLQIHATVRDSAGNEITGLGQQWTSSAQEIAHVGALGLVTAIRDGRTTVTVKVNGKQASAVIDVHAEYGYDLVYSTWDAASSTAARLRHDLGSDVTTPVEVEGAGYAQFVYSPDGTRIAFFGTVDGFTGLFVANGDGSAPLRLQGAPATGCGMVAWRPDGQRLAFVCGFQDADQYIAAIDVDVNAQAVVLTAAESGRDAWPSWSPEIDGGYRIAYARTVAGEPRIFTMAEDGTDHVQVTAGMDDQPSWSPDGSTIAFQRSGAATFGDIWLVDAQGGNERALSFATLAGPQVGPSWSPDGRLLAFVSSHETYGTENSVPQVYTVWADGSKVARRSSGALPKHDAMWVVR